MRGVVLLFSFFFFQAEDGIRDGRVTGVQTCALPICGARKGAGRKMLPKKRKRTVAVQVRLSPVQKKWIDDWAAERDRKSTRLNSSHPSISYAVFCLKKKKKR